MANLVLVVGRKGCGKSTLLRTLVRYHLDTYPDVRFVVWDRTREWIPRDRLVVLSADQYTGEEAAQYAIDHGPCTFVADEIDLICPNHGGGLVEGTALHAIVHYGRHLANGKGVALLCAARRSSRVHIDIRGLADVIFFFRHTEPRDLAWIAELCGYEWADYVGAIPPWQFLRYEV